MHSEHLAVYLVEHFPAVSSQLILDLYRKLATAEDMQLMRGTAELPSEGSAEREPAAVNEFWHGTRCTVGKPGRPHWVASRDTAAR